MLLILIQVLLEKKDENRNYLDIFAQHILASRHQTLRHLHFQENVQGSK
jgi:hypothetical protein